jgi:predicted TIM-barrel fold metal-dependent hydrolase
MVVDVHFHAALGTFSASPGERFSFEPRAAPGPQTPQRLTCDSYLAPRLLRRAGFRLLRAMLGISSGLRGCQLHRALLDTTMRHVEGSSGVDRVVVLAFDEYHTDRGEPLGPAESRRALGSDMYVSNTFVHGLCAAQPDRFLFGASIHPYRTFGAAGAIDMLNEVAAAGAVLVKWLPLVQNIAAEDRRTEAFLRRAGELRMPMLIHYGGEKALSTNHPEHADPTALLATLRRLRREGCMPPVIVAHSATPSAWPLDPLNYFPVMIEALAGEFADAPLYADTAAMGLFTRARFLKRLLKRPDLQGKLVHGSDFPIPVNPTFFLRQLGGDVLRIRRIPSWVERDYRLKLALGLDRSVMTRGWEIIRDGLDHRAGAIEAG